MTKYLDSKGLSYLWQKIVHRFAQRDLTDLSKLANGNVAIWTDAHKLTGKTPKDLAGSVLADEVIALPDGSLVQHVQTGLGTDGKSAGWELNKASSVFGVVATDSPVNSTVGLTPLPIIDGKLYYRDGEDYTHPELEIEKTATTGTPAHSGKFTVIEKLKFEESPEGGAEKGHLIGYTTKEITLPEGYVHPKPTLTQYDAAKVLGHTETFDAITGITVDETGHPTGITKTTYTLPEGYTHPDVNKNDTTSNASPEHGKTFTVIDDVVRDLQGHVTGVNTKTVTLPGLPTINHPVKGIKDGEKILHLDSELKLFSALKLNKVTDANDGTLKIQILGSKSGLFGEDVSNPVDYPVVTELDLTELTKDSFLKSATIHTLSTGDDGQNAWDVEPEGEGVPTIPGTYIRFEWNTREDDETTAQTETTVEYLNVSRLISVYNAGNGIEINDYAGNDGKGKNAKTISVKVDNTAPADGSTLVELNPGPNGLSAKVDLSDYQKSADLGAFDKDDMDAIFDAAEDLYAANNNTPKYPTNAEDPLTNDKLDNEVVENPGIS